MKPDVENDSPFVGREPCPKCGSKDNLGRYADGHAHCYGANCNYWEPADGEVKKGVKKQSEPDESADFDPIEGKYKELAARNISKATCKFFGYRVFTRKKVTRHVIDIRDRTNGNLIAQKIRTKEKDFPVIGDISAKPLIGAHLWSGGRRLVITEGEIDMMTVSQLQKNKWPVVSLLNGASNAKNNLIANIEYLKLFEEVILCFDMDEPGQDAAKECAEVLLSLVPIKIARLPLKDANEMHLEGRGDEVIRALWNAEEYKPDGLLEVDDIIERALEVLPPGLPWIFDGMNDSSNGRHYGEIHTIGAGTGVGKTDLLLQQAAYDMLELKVKVGLFLVENDPDEVLRYLAGKADGRFYYEPGHPDEEDTDAMRAAMSRFRGMCNIYDNWGLCDWDLVKARILYLIANGYRVFYLDHLTALATGAGRDEKEVLEDLMADVAEFAKRHGVLFHLVSHLATPEGKSHEEGGRVTIRNFKGSRSIGFWSHALYGLERDQQAEDLDEKQTTTIRQLKRRKFGKGVGKTTLAKYDVKTGLSKEVKPGASPFDDETEESEANEEEF